MPVWRATGEKSFLRERESPCPSGGYRWHAKSRATQKFKCLVGGSGAVQPWVTLVVSEVKQVSSLKTKGGLIVGCYVVIHQRLRPVDRSNGKFR